MCMFICQIPDNVIQHVCIPIYCNNNTIGDYLVILKPEHSTLKKTQNFSALVVFFLALDLEVPF